MPVGHACAHAAAIWAGAPRYLAAVAACRDGLVIFGLATEALPDRWSHRSGRGLLRRYLFLLRAREAIPDRWSDWSGRGLWRRFGPTSPGRRPKVCRSRP